MEKDIFITSVLFNGSEWSNVSSIHFTCACITNRLVFERSCFEPVSNVTSIHIHSSRTVFYRGSFGGIDQLKMLDLTNSTNLNEDQLFDIIDRRYIPHSETLILANTGVDSEMYSLNEYFWSMIGHRPVFPEWLPG